MIPEKDNIDQLFSRLKGQFDTQEPAAGHQADFLAKLNAQQGVKTLTPGVPKRSWWKPLLVAASIAMIGFFIGVQQTVTPSKELASVSLEMEKTQDFFQSVITNELANIRLSATPETQPVIEDALRRLTDLEVDYDEMKTALAESGEDKRVIYAMIENFQSRINLLEDVVAHIETIKEINKNIVPETI